MEILYSRCLFLYKKLKENNDICKNVNCYLFCKCAKRKQQATQAIHTSQTVLLYFRNRLDAIRTRQAQKTKPHTFVHERRARFPLVTLYDEQHKVFLSDVLGSACWLPLFVAHGISSLLKKVWCHNLVVECIDCPWTKSKLFVPVRACLNVCWAQMCYLWLLGLLETSVFFLILIYCLQGINNSVPQLL